MNIRRYLLLIAAIMMLLASDKSQAADFGGGLMDILGKDIQISGETDYLKDEGAIIVRKYATVSTGGRTIRAKNIIVWETKQVYAEGDVSVEDPNGRSFFCDTLYWDLATWKGRAVNIHLKLHDANTVPESPLHNDIVGKRPNPGRPASYSFDPDFKVMNIYAEDIRVIDKTHIQATNVKLTPDMFADPHWYIQSGSVNVIRGSKVESWNNLLKIGRVPVFYFPYIIKDLRYDWPWMRASAGSSSKWGYYILTKWGFDLNPEEEDWFRMRKIFVEGDYYQDRGWGGGLEFEYEMGKGNSVGFLNAYHIYESGISSKDDLERANEDNDFPGDDYTSNKAWKPALYRDESRYQIDWWQRNELTKRWDIRMEAHKDSDRNFVPSYFRSEYDTQKDEENSADLRYLHEKFVFDIVVSDPSNDWQNQPSYLPELRFSLPGLQLGKSPFYLKNDTVAGVVRQSYDDLPRELDLRDPDYHKVKSGDDQTPAFARAVTDTRIVMPIDIYGWTLAPYAGGMAGHYEETYGENQDGKGGSQTNAAALYGADLSTVAIGEYRDGEYRHMMEPTLSWIANEKPIVDSDELYGIDYFDQYDESHFLTLNWYNTLTRKEGDGYRNLATFNAKFSYLPYDEEAERINKGRSFTDVELNATYYPTDNLEFHANAMVNPDGGNLTRYGAGMDWTISNRLRAYMTQQYRRGASISGSSDERADSNQTKLALRTQLWNEHSNYSLETAFSYEHEDSGDGYIGNDGRRRGSVRRGFNSVKVTLIRDLGSVELAFSFFDNPTTDDKGVALEVRAKGWRTQQKGPTGDDSGFDTFDSRYSSEKDEEDAMANSFGDKKASSKPNATN